MPNFMHWAPLVLAALSGCTVVQGSGRVVTEDRSVASFQAIESAGTAEVQVVLGAGSITVTTDDNLQQYVLTRVENGTLIIEEQQRLLLHATHGIVVRVSTPVAPTKVSVSGTGNLLWADPTPLAVDTLGLDVSGTGSIEAALNATTLNVDVSGTGSIELTGLATTGEVDLSGTGGLRAFGLQLQTARVTVSGTGNAELKVSDSLDATVSGTGSVYYRGAPSITKRVSGTGGVTDAN